MTCGECTWKAETYPCGGVLCGIGHRSLGGLIDPMTRECAPRQAFRVCRDEVRAQNKTIEEQNEIIKILMEDKGGVC